MMKRIAILLLGIAGVMGAWAQSVPQVINVMNRRALLYFGAVNYDCHVYVNGKKAGHHVGGFTPFNFDVTDLLHEGRNFAILATKAGTTQHFFRNIRLT